MGAKVGEVEYEVRMSDAKIGPDADKAQSSIASKMDAMMGTINKSFGWQLLKDIGGAFIDMGKQAVGAFTDISKAALDSVASYEQNIGGIETLYGDSADIVIGRAEAAFATAGMSANEYMENVTSFSAALIRSLDGDTEAAALKADKAIIAMSDNANKMGTDIASIQNAYQGFAKGNFTMLDNLKLGYGGTESEMKRLIADANKVKVANGEMADLSIKSFADITEAIDIIQTEMGITGATAKEASTTIEGSMKAAKAAYDNFLSGSITGYQFGETLITAAENVLTNLVGIIENFAQQIPPLVKALVEGIPPLIEEFGPPLMDAILTLVPAVVDSAVQLMGFLIDALMEALPQILDAAISILDKLITGLIDNLPKLIEAAFLIIDKLVNYLVDNLPHLLDVALRLIMTLAQGLISNLPKLIDAALRLVQALIQYVLAHLPEIIQMGIKLISELAHGLLQALPQIISAMTEVISGLLTYVLNHLPEIIQMGITLIGKLAAGLVQALPQILSSMGQIVTGLMKVITSTNWLKLGLDIIKGVAKGIAGAAGQIWEALKGAISDALSWAKKLLKIESPSKVFADQVGAMIPAGMAEGIDDGQDVVDESLSNLTRHMLADVGVSLPDISGYASALGASITASSNTAITVPVMLDGREIARGTAYYMDQQLAWEAI